MKVFWNSYIARQEMNDSLATFLLNLNNVKELTFSTPREEYLRVIFKILAQKKTLEKLSLINASVYYENFDTFFLMLEKNDSLNNINVDALFQTKFTEQDFNRISKFPKKKIVMSYHHHPSNYADALRNNQELHNVYFSPLSFNGIEYPLPDHKRNIQLYKILAMNFHSHSEDLAFHFL